MKVNPIGDKIACISILKIGCQLILLQNLQTFHTPLNVVNYDIVMLDLIINLKSMIILQNTLYESWCTKTF